MKPIIRTACYFEHIFGKMDSQELVTMAVRKSLQTGRPFFRCDKCLMFQIKGFNGGAWWEEEKTTLIESKTMVRLLRLRILELTTIPFENLFEIKRCPTCQ